MQAQFLAGGLHGQAEYITVAVQFFDLVVYQGKRREAVFQFRAEEGIAKFAVVVLAPLVGIEHEHSWREPVVIVDAIADLINAAREIRIGVALGFEVKEEPDFAPALLEVALEELVGMAPLRFRLGQQLVFFLLLGLQAPAEVDLVRIAGEEIAYEGFSAVFDDALPQQVFADFPVNGVGHRLRVLRWSTKKLSMI